MSCFLKGMQPNPTPATDEIQAYLALRDQALAQAEDAMTEAALLRASMANDFAAECLRPARSPYQAQSLSEDEARRERQRCATVAVRIGNLKARLIAGSRIPALAA